MLLLLPVSFLFTPLLDADGILTLLMGAPLSFSGPLMLLHAGENFAGPGS